MATYKKPSTVGNVADAQKSLNKYYGANLAVDGVWGPLTDAAWNKAQPSQTTTPKLPATIPMSDAEKDGLYATEATFNATHGATAPVVTTPGADTTTPALPVTPPVDPNAFTANPQIGTLQTDISNFKINPYDPNSDPAFASYKDKYNDAGIHASSDVMGQAAAASGGRISSYSQAVGSQAKASWDQRLMDVTPTLQAASDQRQNDNLNRMYNQLTMLQNSDNTAYNRGRDVKADAKAISDDKLAQDLATLGQYSGNYQKEINSRTATPDTSDDYLIPYLQTEREDKINQQTAAKATQDEKDAKAAMDAEQLVYDRSTKAEQTVYDRGQDTIKNNNDTRNTNSLIANRGSSGSKASTDITTMGTPEQIALYSGMMDTFGGNGVSSTYKGADGIQKAALWVSTHEVDLTQKLGAKLYARMSTQLKGADTIAGAPKAPPSDPNYDYKTDPDFSANISGINANPKIAVASVTDNSTQLIADYTYAGYQALLTAAKAAEARTKSSTSGGIVIPGAVN